MVITLCFSLFIAKEKDDIPEELKNFLKINKILSDEIQADQNLKNSIHGLTTVPFSISLMDRTILKDLKKNKRVLKTASIHLKTEKIKMQRNWNFIRILMEVDQKNVVEIFSFLIEESEDMNNSILLMLGKFKNLLYAHIKMWPIFHRVYCDWNLELLEVFCIQLHSIPLKEYLTHQFEDFQNQESTNMEIKVYKRQILEYVNTLIRQTTEIAEVAQFYNKLTFQILSSPDFLTFKDNLKLLIVYGASEKLDSNFQTIERDVLKISAKLHQQNVSRQTSLNDIMKNSKQTAFSKVLFEEMVEKINELNSRARNIQNIYKNIDLLSNVLPVIANIGILAMGQLEDHVSEVQFLI